MYFLFECFKSACALKINGKIETGNDPYYKYHSLCSLSLESASKFCPPSVLHRIKWKYRVSTCGSQMKITWEQLGLLPWEIEASNNTKRKMTI